MQEVQEAGCGSLVSAGSWVWLSSLQIAGCGSLVSAGSWVGCVVCAGACVVPQLRQLVYLCLISPYLLIEFQPKHLQSNDITFFLFYHGRFCLLPAKGYP